MRETAIRLGCGLSLFGGSAPLVLSLYSMTDAPLLFADQLPAVEPPTRTRRKLATAPRKRMQGGRPARLEERNRVLVARYYYWTEIRRRRADDVRQILIDQEFFVEARTIWNVLLDQGDYLSQLLRERPTASELRQQWPSWSWS